MEWAIDWLCHLLRLRYFANYRRLCHPDFIFWSIFELSDWEPSQICDSLFFWQYPSLSCVHPSLSRTGFLLGFKRQCKNMVDADRRICSIIFLSALVGTLFSALVIGSKLLVLLCLMVQIPAYIWYCASYIPFARDCIKSCLKSIRDKLRWFSSDLIINNKRIKSFLLFHLRIFGLFDLLDPIIVFPSEMWFLTRFRTFTSSDHQIYQPVLHFLHHCTHPVFIITTLNKIYNSIT